MAAKRKIMNNHLKMVRSVNTLKVLKKILQCEPVSRIEISKTTGLSPTTITNIVERLKINGWLYETDEGVSNGGRKPILLSINKNSRFVISVQVTPRSVRGVIYNLEPSAIYRIERGVARLGDGVLEALLDVIGELTGYAKGKGLETLAIGLNIPGAINVKSGILLYSTDLELENLRLKEIIEERFDISVHIQNDANLAALAEKTYGIARNESSMVYIKDMGGAGIIINGEIYLGYNGVAGELGHISIDKNGEKCKCGNYGCLYQYVSEMAIEANAIKAMKQGVKTTLYQVAGSDYNKVTMGAIIRAANENDAFAKQLITDVAENLGVGIVSLVNILDIRFIVIGGAITKAGDFFFQRVLDTFRSRTSKMSFKNIRIERSGMDENIGLLGCFCMIMNETFRTSLKLRN